MQATILERNTQDISLAATRRAQEANKRDRKRQLKAETASRASSRMVSRVTSIMPTRRQSFDTTMSITPGSDSVQAVVGGSQGHASSLGLSSTASHSDTGSVVVPGEGPQHEQPSSPLPNVNETP